MALKAKQEMFCQEYLIDFNATQAAIRAGYASANADVTGPRLLGNVGIGDRIAELMHERNEGLGVTVQMIVDGLLSEARYFGEGASHSARISAWKALGEYRGMFVENKPKNQRPNDPPVSNLTPDE